MVRRRMKDSPSSSVPGWRCWSTTRSMKTRSVGRISRRAHCRYSSRRASTRCSPWRRRGRRFTTPRGSRASLAYRRRSNPFPRDVQACPAGSSADERAGADFVKLVAFQRHCVGRACCKGLGRQSQALPAAALRAQDNLLLLLDDTSAVVAAT